MKFIMSVLTLIFAVASVPAFASGRISLQPSYDAVHDKASYQVGLSIYEKMMDGVFYNSWTGTGDSLSEESPSYRQWYVTKHQVDFKADGLIFSPGVKALYNPDVGPFNDRTVQTEIFGKITLELW